MEKTQMGALYLFVQGHGARLCGLLLHCLDTRDGFSCPKILAKVWATRCKWVLSTSFQKALEQASMVVSEKSASPFLCGSALLRGEIKAGPFVVSPHFCHFCLLEMNKEGGFHLDRLTRRRIVSKW